ncbi:MAG: UDP-N-acetylmuramoylalanine--D-glutamate ligase [Acidimicrobiales bacterium]|jgi:UDP-N-acetylmuramoylalanine--D-glutamate ligase
MQRMMVVGMGITGRAVATALQQRGIDVVALDDRISDELRSWSTDHNLVVHTPGDVNIDALLAQVNGVLPAPGLPDHHPIFAAAAQAKAPIMSEFDLAALWDDRPAVAITGTDGKTTVVTLVERMLEQSGITAKAVGNTDTPWVEAIDDPATDVFVVEASSFRLGHSQHFSPSIGTWLNFGPDHLDAHRDLAGYEAAKAAIWSQLGPDALAVANRDDIVVSGHATMISSSDVETFGAGEPSTTRDHGVIDGVLVSGGHELIAISELTRTLPHDIMNGLAASATALRAGARHAVVADVLRNFAGLEHRVEFIAEIDGVRYINDSKATTPHAAAAALGGFDSVVLLAGGKNKGLSFDDMVAHSDRITHVVAIGDAALDIEAAFAGRVSVSVATSMTQAVAQARDIATTGDVVLLSPACASYDWYRSYAHRGEDFAQIVRAQTLWGQAP